MGIFSQNAPSPLVAEKARRDRSTDELLGLCRGILADGNGNVNLSEAKFLLYWLERHHEFLSVFPFDSLYRRVGDALCDGVLDGDEERDLLECLVQTVGGETSAHGSATSLSTTLPFNDPLPAITYANTTFVVTGTFEFGCRRAVVDAIHERGGLVKPAISKKVQFLVVGEIGSRDWKHSSFGRKIEEAIDLRSSGVALAVLPESYWRHSLESI